MTDLMKQMRTDPARFWEERYASASPETSGQPGAALRLLVEPLEPGRALELGCGRGDDAVWLAGRGWSVLAVEISPTALECTRQNAKRAGVSDRVVLEQHDLTQSFPEGRFDLVVASFLAVFPREGVLRRAAEAVRPGGHLLLIDHGSRAPWSWGDHDFPTPEEALETLRLDERDWHRIRVGTLERRATGPGGQQATVLDNLLLLKRTGG